MRKVVKKSGKVHETNPKGIVGSFQVMVPWPQDLQGNLRKYHCMNRDHRFDSYLFFIWLVEIHWLLDAQITFWDCRVHFRPFFFQQPFLKPVVYKQVCRAHQTLVINQKGQNELSISKIQFNSRGDSLTDWQLAEIMACFLAESLVHINTNHGDIHTINYCKGATLFVEHSSHTWEEWHFSYFIIYQNHP